MVDIICEKIAEGGDNDQFSSSNQATNNAGNNGGPNYRGGPSSGATKLTDEANNSAFNTQTCQCWSINYYLNKKKTSFITYFFKLK